MMGKKKKRGKKLARKFLANALGVNPRGAPNVMRLVWFVRLIMYLVLMI